MNEYSRLKEYLREIARTDDQPTVCQGIVQAVSGNQCDVQVGSLVIPGVRLRASMAADDSEMLVTPKVGSAVIFGTLSGDFSQLVVLQVDHAESITINGGKLGGLVNIGTLTDRLNALADDVNSLITKFNAHTHAVPNGTSAAPSATANETASFDRGDYEDETIKH